MSNSGSWLPIYHAQILQGLVEQKNKVDGCLNWLIVIFTAALGGYFFLVKDEPILAPFICLVAIAYTVFIMQRSIRAYRQLVNFNEILRRITSALEYPLVLNNIHAVKWAREHLDYPKQKKKAVFLMSSREAYKKFLLEEYGFVIIVMYMLLISSLIRIFAPLTYKEISDSPSLWSFIILVIILVGVVFIVAHSIRPNPGMDEYKSPSSCLLGLGDLLDRTAIDEIKLQKLNDLIRNDMPGITERIEIYKDEAEKICSMSDEIDYKELLDKFLRLHGMMWVLEDKVRSRPTSKRDFETIGKAATKLRNLNNFRVKLRNRINRLSMSGFIEPEV